MKNVGKILAVSRPLYHLMAIIVVLIVVNAVLELLVPLLSKSIVDGIVSHLTKQSGNLNQLFFLIGAMFAAGAIGAVLNAGSDRLGDHFAGRLRQLLTEKFYYKILQLPQSYFDSELSGKIVNQLGRGINTIQGFINASSNFIVPMFLQSVFTIIVLAKYNLPISLLTLSLFPIYLALTYYSSKKWGKEEEAKNIHEDLARGRIQEVVSNIKIVKGFNAGRSEYHFISGELSEINKIYARQSQTFHIFDLARNLSLNAILLGINLIVFWNTFQGLLTIGEMVLIIQLIAQARRPLFAMSFILTQLQNAESGSKEFFEILALPGTEAIESEKNLVTMKSPTIEFENVSFGYNDSAKVLNDVSFLINAKDTVALVGPSGAGKTTIVNLILKFYEPTGGEISLGNKPVADLPARQVRHNIALVFQDNELFSTTIRDNVAYGTSASEEKIVQALKLANAWDFVSKLPKGPDSQVGERGVKLSGGQKQRIQIARAILKDSPILILDEATSNLDAKSEREVQEGLANLFKDKLVIIIAHRFSTIQDADKVIVLENGRVVEMGQPKELANKPGIYSDLLRYQIEGNKKLLEGFELY